MCILTYTQVSIKKYNSLTRCNCTIIVKILQADMQLSMRSLSCSPHGLTARGFGTLTSSNITCSQCEPIDLGHFVVDLRNRHLHNWEPFSQCPPVRAQR